MPGRPLRRFAVTAQTDDGPKHLHVAAASVRQATRMARSFLEFVDHGGYERLEVEAAEVEGTPKYGDLGATPLGQSEQTVADVLRW